MELRKVRHAHRTWAAPVTPEFEDNHLAAEVCEGHPPTAVEIGRVNLGCGLAGHLPELRRSKVHRWKLEPALPLPDDKIAAHFREFVGVPATRETDQKLVGSFGEVVLDDDLAIHSGPNLRIQCMGDHSERVFGHAGVRHEDFRVK